MKKLILVAAAAIPMIMAASAAKAFIVFAPAAFAGVVIGSIAFGALTTALFGHAWVAPFTPVQPVVEQPVIEQTYVAPPRRHHTVYYRQGY